MPIVHSGLQQAIRQVLQGAMWQRCRVHFMRNVLAQVPRSSQALVAALVKTIFVQPGQAKAREEWARVVAG
jgi:putative transposase